MANIDFCVIEPFLYFYNLKKLTENDFVCVVESIFGILPFILFVILGYYSFRETRAITSYSREPYTWRHVIKLAFSGLLALISFGLNPNIKYLFIFQAFLLVYLLTETDISLKTVVVRNRKDYKMFNMRIDLGCDVFSLGI